LEEEVVGFSCPIPKTGKLQLPPSFPEKQGTFLTLFDYLCENGFIGDP
jgi:hypothetical protein